MIRDLSRVRTTAWDNGGTAMMIEQGAAALSAAIAPDTLGPIPH
jgi:hypothetical protein